MRRITAMPNTTRHALVAGGAGFIGSHLCQALLAEGSRVTCLDSLSTGSLDNLAPALRNGRFRFIRCDIVDELPCNGLAGAIDEIYNLACAASPVHYQADPHHTMLTNVVGTLQLLELAELCSARFLLASTSEVYGDPDVHPQPETYLGNVNSCGPRACYDEGKRAGEAIVFDFDRSTPGLVRVARIFNTYGPRLAPDDGRLISNFVRQALGGEPITIYGDGSQTRSFCYVDDMVRGLIALQRHEGEQPGPVNLGNPTERSVMEIADTVTALTGSASPMVFKPLPVDDPKRRRPDIGRAHRVLGWSPRIALEEGLNRTIAWMRGVLPQAVMARPPRLQAAE